MSTARAVHGRVTPVTRPRPASESSAPGFGTGPPRASGSDHTQAPSPPTVSPSVRLILLGLATTSGNAILAQAFGVASLAVTAPAFVLPSASALLGIMVMRVRLGGAIDVARLLARGATWGLIATCAYDALRPPMRAIFSFHYDPLYAVTVFGAEITGAAADSAIALAVGWAYHFWNGASFGIIFVLLWSRGGALAGLACAGLLQALLMATYPRLVGVQLTDPGFLVMGLVGHAVFGLVLGWGITQGEHVSRRAPHTGLVG